MRMKWTPTCATKHPSEYAKPGQNCEGGNVSGEMMNKGYTAIAAPKSQGAMKRVK